ncbi:hypothetical protein HHX48_17770 [Salinimonas sp. HHU 13199]|uniref:Large polyvalent protein-associated domain-containing protein n=1 Tax=Salinimonas profundi TaxID=2729140 RepID=A0ABR8LN33_9ALTE|nr:hypothetical protein [Salinimonas profundi]MBD3587590.1 hypothetical protein [Salinimonas profundi]
MANLIDATDPSIYQYAKPNWESVYSKFQPYVMALPQVKSGGVSKQQASNWLEVGAKLLKESELRRLMVESSGFTARDIRALWAHKHNEYYPKYEATEVYRQKQLTAIRTPDIALQDEGFLKAVLRQVAMEKYGFSDVQDVVSSQSANQLANRIPWAVKKDVLLGQIDNTIFTYDVKVGYEQTLTHSDSIRHHFNHLALADKNIESGHSDQYNFSVSPELTKTITDLAKQKGDGWRLAIELAKSAEKMGIGVDISKERISPTPEIFQTLLTVGNEHWANIKNGVQPTFQAKVESTYTPEEATTYRQLAQQYTVSKMAKEVAEEQFNHTRDELTRLVGIERAGTATPHPLVAASGKSNFDIASAVNRLQSQGVPEDFYKSATYDIDALVKAAEASGVDTNQYKSYGQADKSKVLSSLEMVGISKDAFTTRDIHIHFTSQTRGVLSEVKSQARNLVETHYEAMKTNVANNDLLKADSISKKLQPQEPVELKEAVDEQNTLGMG